MLDKLKDIYQLQKQARAMQAILAKEEVTGTSRDGSFSITINGNQDVRGVTVVDGTELTKEIIERNAKEAFTDALTKVKNIMAQKMQGMM
jgi:DNA-binding protein YbaB